MARVEHYNTEKTYRARRMLSIPETGKFYKQGEEVPRDGLSEFQYRRMFEVRKIVSYTRPLGEPAPDAAPSATMTVSTDASEASIAALAEAAKAAADALTAQALGEGAPAAAIEAKPAEPEELPDAGAGYIEHSARGWYNVFIARKPPVKMRGEDKANAELARLRAELGIVVEEPAAPLPPAQLQPGEEYVTEEGEILTMPTDDAALADHTGGETTELPDEETPSAPFAPGMAAPEILEDESGPPLTAAEVAS